MILTKFGMSVVATPTF